MATGNWKKRKTQEKGNLSNKHNIDEDQGTEAEERPGAYWTPWAPVLSDTFCLHVLINYNSSRAIHLSYCFNTVWKIRYKGILQVYFLFQQKKVK